MMPQSENQAIQPATSSRLGGFLRRLLLAFIKLLLIFIFIVAILGSAWLIHREINRSFDVVNSRTDFIIGQLNQAEDDIALLQEANDTAGNRIEALQTAAANRDATIATLESELTTTQDQQDETLALLEADVNDLLASTTIISDNLAFVSDGLVSLQQDTTTNVSDIDALGGEIDVLHASLDTLNNQIAAIQLELGAYSADEFERMQQTIALFRLWEMVSRARLHLLEQNVGLATDDLTSAQAAIDQMLGALPEEDVVTRTGLEQIRDRLILAGTNLPDDTVAAARDLETAWELLDRALAELSGEASLSPTATPTPVPESSS